MEGKRRRNGVKCKWRMLGGHTLVIYWEISVWGLKISGNNTIRGGYDRHTQPEKKLSG